jgi:CRISPR-associated endonuclease/helicase Cas3
MASTEKAYHINPIYDMFNEFDKIGEKAIECANKGEGKCVCVLLDTVDRAQQCYEALQNLFSQRNIDDIDLSLFHARFVQEDRNRIEEEILKKFDDRSLKPGSEHLRPKKAILVATQVVEQSLDVDFDEIITDIAPIDLLIQRFGRVHRHHRPNRVEPDLTLCHIIMPDKTTIDFGTIRNVYSEYLLLTTYFYLQSQTKISLPNTIREAIEYVYRDFNETQFANLDEAILSRLRSSATEFEEHNNVNRGAAKPYLIAEPSYLSNNLMVIPYNKVEDDDEHGSNEISFFYIKTRLGDYTRRCCFVDENDYPMSSTDQSPPNKEALKALYLKTVNIPYYWFKDLPHASGFESIFEPKWMPGVFIFKMKNNIWKGIDPNGKLVIFIRSSEKGIVRNTQ